MTFVGQINEEGDHVILVGTCDGRNVGGERLEQFVRRVLGSAISTGKEIVIIMMERPSNRIVMDPEFLQPTDGV